MIAEAIRKLVLKKGLKEREVKDSFREILEGKATPVQISAFIVGLRIKGETPDEITWAAEVMRQKSVKIDVRQALNIDREEINLDEEGDEIVFDTCGTGGAVVKTFNVSTSVAFVIAGCGVRVAKHGNRAASSRCGSADILEALGINIGLSPPKVKECIKKIGIGFLYAPLYHSSMRYAAPVRKELGLRSIFNILGPLCNPAAANYQLLGVYTKHLTFTLAKVLKNLGVKRAFVVWGEDGVDEISITGPTFVSYLNKSRIRNIVLRPRDFGKKKSSIKDIAGGTTRDNVRLIMNVLRGRKGPARDIVEINAASSLFLSQQARTLKEGVRLAGECIDRGKALEKLRLLKEFTQDAS